MHFLYRQFPIKIGNTLRLNHKLELSAYLLFVQEHGLSSASYKHIMLLALATIIMQ